MDGQKPKPTRSPVRLASLVCVTALAALALAWFDVLPGGWTLRGLVRSHAAREAEERAAHRAARLAAFAEEPAVAGAVVFLGSSTIERFPLERGFPGLPTIDRGIGDESLPELLARIPACLPPAPRAFVVYAGSVEARRLARPADEIARDAAALLDRLAEAAPGAPVVWLGILPDRDGDAEVDARVRALDRALAALVTARGGTYVTTLRPPLLAPDGRLAPRYAADALHLSADGYDVVAEWLHDALPALNAPITHPQQVLVK